MAKVVCSIHECLPYNLLACCVSVMSAAVLYIGLLARASCVFLAVGFLVALFFSGLNLQKTPCLKASPLHAVTWHGCSLSGSQCRCKALCGHTPPSLKVDSLRTRPHVFRLSFGGPNKTKLTILDILRGMRFLNWIGRHFVQFLPQAGHLEQGTVEEDRIKGISARSPKGVLGSFRLKWICPPLRFCRNPGAYRLDLDWEAPCQLDLLLTTAGKAEN